MNNFISARNNIIKFYQKNYKIFNIVVKFIIGFIMYFYLLNISNANGVKGFIPNTFLCIITSVMLAIVFAFVSYQTSFFMAIIATFLGFSGNVVLSIIVSSILFVVFLLYVNVSKKESILLLVTVISFYLKVPYFAPIVAGLLYGKTSFLPVFLGVFTYFLLTGSIDILIEANELTEEIDLIEMGIFSGLKMLEYVFLSKMFLFTGITFIFSTIIVNIVSHIDMNYNREISILIATIIFVGASVIYTFAINPESNILLSIISIIASVILAYICSCFDGIFDYKKVQKVYFQDEENVYYVKIVPKIK